MKLSHAGEQAPLRGFGGTPDERKAAAESAEIELKSVRPYARRYAIRESEALLDRLTADELPSYEEMLDVRAGLRAIMSQLKAMDTALSLYGAYLREEANDA